MNEGYQMKRWALLFFILVFISGCSINRMAIRRAAGMIEIGMSAVYEEEDLELAKVSIEANLKLLEVLLKNDPENDRLKLLLAQGYGSYALGFVEDVDKERAKYFYLKGRNYALEVLKKNKILAKKINQSLQDWEKGLEKTDRKWVPALFWSAFNWGGYINLSLDNPRAIFDLGKVEAMMRRVVELDESYYFAGAHLFLGSMAGARPKLLGGDPEKAKSHFERAIQLTDGRFLMTYVYYAKYYAIQTLNEEKFDELVHHVLDARLDILPEYKLINQIAKKKAEMLLRSKSDIF
jgi:tetratricopeptide (TPR) repeat protein